MRAEEEGGAPEPQEALPDPAPRGHEETEIESSIVAPYSLPSELAAVVPDRRLRPLHVAIGALVLLGLLGALLGFQRQRRLRAAVDAIAAAVARNDPEEALRLVEALPDGVRHDYRIRGYARTLTTEVAQRRARRQADEALAGLRSASTFQERLELCEVAVGADPRHGRALAALAHARYARDRRRVTSAAELRRLVRGLRRALQRRYPSAKDSPWFDHVLAQVLLANGDLAAARTVLQRLAARDGEGPRVLLARGRLKLLDGDLAGAERTLSRVVASNPEWSDACLARAEARLRRRSLGGAFRDASLACELDPLSPRALAVRAEVRLAKGELREARVDLDAALNLDPSRSDALALRAWVAAHGDVQAEAVQTSVLRDARAALRISPRRFRARLARARVYVAQGRLRLASSEVGKARLGAEDRGEIYRMRARILLRRGERGRALEDAQRAIKLDPEDVDALLLLARIYLTQRALARARPLLQRALALDDARAEAYFCRGLLHYQQREPQLKAAIADLTRALSLRPGYTAALFHRARARLAAKQYVSALQDLRRAEKDARRGDFPAHEAHLVRGHVHFQLEEWGQAAEAYRAFLKAAPGGHTARVRVRERLRNCERLR